MPPLQPMEIIVAFGILAGIVMFMILFVLLGVVVLIEKAVLRGNRSSPRLEREHE